MAAVNSASHLLKIIGRGKNSLFGKQYFILFLPLVVLSFLYQDKSATSPSCEPLGASSHNQTRC
jgi:hypothetical protein